MVTVIAETSGNSLHPVTAQLVGAAGGDAGAPAPHAGAGKGAQKEGGGGGRPESPES